jgi:DNA-binding transcriptional LysR family regulator
VLDLYKLQYFVVVAKTGSFRQAAEQLHLSQPALSRSIQALERRYGVMLLDRSRTGVYLTAVGQQLLARAEELIYNAETLEHIVGSASRVH